MTNPVIGYCNCPLCNAIGRTTRATVHRENRSAKKIYYRCPECGTIQPRLPGGQKVLLKISKPVADRPTEKPEPTEPKKQHPENPKKSPLSTLLNGFLTED